MFFFHRQDSSKPAAAAAKPASAPNRQAFSTLLDDDWMFGCQKPMAASSNPPADADAPPAGQGAPPADGLIPTAPGTGESSSTEQLLPTGGQTLGPAAQTTSPKRQQASTTSPSVPALRSSISFANALPPIPVGLATQQAQSRDGAVNIHSDQRKASQQQGASAAAVAGVGGRSLTAEQQVRASVSDWLLRQDSGDVQQTSSHGSGDCLVQPATGDEEERSQASGSRGASDDDAAGPQVTSCLQICLCARLRSLPKSCGAVTMPACLTTTFVHAFPICMSPVANHESMQQHRGASAHVISEGSAARTRACGQRAEISSCSLAPSPFCDARCRARNRSALKLAAIATKVA